MAVVRQFACPPDACGIYLCRMPRALAAGSGSPRPAGRACFLTGKLFAACTLRVKTSRRPLKMCAVPSPCSAPGGHHHLAQP